MRLLSRMRSYVFPTRALSISVGSARIPLRTVVDDILERPFFSTSVTRAAKWHTCRHVSFLNGLRHAASSLHQVASASDAAVQQTTRRTVTRSKIRRAVRQQFLERTASPILVLAVSEGVACEVGYGAGRWGRPVRVGASEQG